MTGKNMSGKRLKINSNNDILKSIGQASAGADSQAIACCRGCGNPQATDNGKKSWLAVAKLKDSGSKRGSAQKEKTCKR